MEHQMMQIEKTYNYNSGHLICKGITERYNYIITNHAFYDIYFGLPFKFFPNTKMLSKTTMNLFERKFSKYNNDYLD